MSDSTLQLFKAQSGMVSAKIVREDGTLLHLHSLVKPEEEGKYFEEISLWGDRIIFLGTGLGYHILPILKKIPRNTELLFVEYYDELLQQCIGQVISKTDVIINKISGTTTDFNKIIRKFIDDAKSVQIIRHPPSIAANKPFFDNISKFLYSRSCKSDVGKKMVLLYGGFFLQEELKNAISQSSVTPVLLNYSDIDSSIEFESRVEQIFQFEKPSGILSINMLGFDGNGVLPDLAFKYGIPLIVWFVDDPRPILLHQKQFIKPNMIAFCWERQYVPLLKEAGFSVADYLPLATDPNLFSIGNTQKHLANTGFVGSSMGREFLERIAGKFLWRNELEPLVDAAAKRVMENEGPGIEEIIRQECIRIGLRIPFTDERNLVWFQSYIIHTASMLKRKQIIEALIPWGLKTFGDPEGWRELLGDNFPAEPDIDYRTDLASVYRGIDINLNITSSQMPTAVNQRVFDVPACGAFLLTDRQKDLESLFNDEEVAVYSCVEELIEKVNFFLRNEKERKRISGCARKRILEEHTYLHRFKQICKKVNIFSL